MKKAFWLLRKAVNVITVLGTLFCVFVNMDIIASAYSYFSASGDKTLIARFWDWVDSIYGEEKGSEICFEVEDWTLEMVKKGNNKKLFFIISIMMILSILLGIKDKSKSNRKLRVYYVAFFLFMCFITYLIAPIYVDFAYE